MTAIPVEGRAQKLGIDNFAVMFHTVVQFQKAVCKVGIVFIIALLCFTGVMCSIWKRTIGVSHFVPAHPYIN
jgi:hypothetical protein